MLCDHSDSRKPVSNERRDSIDAHSRLTATATAIVMLLSTAGIQAETWTSLSGNSSVEAKMIGLWDDKVVLSLPGGRQIQVPMDSLNAPSRIQARRVSDQQADRRGQLRVELQRRVKEAAAPAPDPLPSPDPASPYQSPQPDMTADQALQLIQDQLRDGHLVVLLDALPMKFRGDLNQLVALLAKKLNPQDWSEAWSQMHGVSDLLVTRQNWIFSHPRMTQGDGRDRDLSEAGTVFQNLILPAAGAVRSGLSPEQTKLETIQAEGFGTWLQKRDGEIAPYLSTLMQQYANFDKSWTVHESVPKSKSSKQDSTFVQSDFSSPDGTVSRLVIEMVKVDGYWVPKSVSDGLDDWIKEQTLALEKLDDGSIRLSDLLGAASFEMGSYDDDNPDDELMEEDLDSHESNSTEPEGEYALADHLAPSVIVGEQIGMGLQAIMTIAGLIGPLEAATDATSFHQAAHDLVSPLTSLVDMIRP